MKEKGITLSGLLFVVFIIFLVLKLTDTVDWSWLMVTLPLWFPIIAGLTIGIFAVICYLIITLIFCVYEEFRK